MTLNNTNGQGAIPLHPVRFMLQLLGKTDDPVCFREAHVQMEGQAVTVTKFTVTCKFRTTLLPCPVFTDGQQLFYMAPASAMVAVFIIIPTPHSNNTIE